MINLSSLALLEGEPRRAARVGAEAVALASTQRDAETKAVALFNLGCAHLETGEPELPRATFAASTRLCLDGGFREHLALLPRRSRRRGRASRRRARGGCASRRCRHDAGVDGCGARSVRAAGCGHERCWPCRATLADDADRVWSEGRDRRPEEMLEAALANAGASAVTRDDGAARPCEPERCCVFRNSRQYEFASARTSVTNGNLSNSSVSRVRAGDHLHLRELAGDDASTYWALASSPAPRPRRPCRSGSVRRCAPCRRTCSRRPPGRRERRESRRPGSSSGLSAGGAHG